MKPSELAARVTTLVEEHLPEARAERAEMLNEVRRALSAAAGPVSMPVDVVEWVPFERVRPNDYNPNSVPPKELALLKHSVLADGYCVEASTPVLRADLKWIPAGDLVVGDRLIGFDEEPVATSATRKARRYRTALVERNALERRLVMRVSTTRGSLLVTPDHPFLTRRRYGKGLHAAVWMEARDLRQGDSVVHLMHPWLGDRSWEAGWLAGFLDGEGTLSGRRLSGSQRPGPTADKMIAEMTRRAPTRVFTTVRPNPKWNDMVMARVDRLTAVMRLLGEVRPERLITAGGDFWEGVALWSTAKGVSDLAEVVSVEAHGVGVIARLATSTRTYIANGFAVHNTQPVVTIYNEEDGVYEIVDGFHRYLVGGDPEVAERLHGLLPVVVIRKDINDRMASTVRHNRARGAHAITGMAGIVFSMLQNGWDDKAVCRELGMTADELTRVKHVTGYAKLYEGAEYSRAVIPGGLADMFTRTYDGHLGAEGEADGGIDGAGDRNTDDPPAEVGG